MRRWSHKEIEGGILKPLSQTTSQMESVWSCYVDRKKLGQMGPIKGWGPLSEVSLSLFTMELERWALNLNLLISLVPTNGFEFHDLQVRVLVESILFSGLQSTFGHPKVLHELVGVSWSQVAPFKGKRVTWSYLWGIFE